MAGKLRKLSGLALALGLAACGPGENDPGPGGVTVGEARALDEAAEMIEQGRPSARVVAVPEPAASADSASAGAQGSAASGGEDHPKN